MARTERTDKHREKDHKLTKNQFIKKADEIKTRNISGKAFWCEHREQMIPADKICHKIQTTQGCKIGIYNPDTQTGCPLFESKLAVKAEGNKSKGKGKGSGKLSYQTIMKNIFLEKGYSSLDDLVTAINDHPSRKGVNRPADNKNVSVGISILKNSNRVKAPLRIDFSRKLKLYFYLDFEGENMKNKITKLEAEYDAKVKKEKAAEKKALDDKIDKDRVVIVTPFVDLAAQKKKNAAPPKDKKPSPKKTAPKKTTTKPKK
ncbi:MAG: hypothetical protein ACXADW_21860 [Candidatus Hodarchaeales archaeon]|jgi:hypothetical protein